MAKNSVVSKFSHLEGSKDEEKIKALVEETEAMDHQQFELKKVCMGIASEDMYVEWL